LVPLATLEPTAGEAVLGQQGALIRLEKTENGAKQNSAVKTKWLLIVFWGSPNNIKTVSFNIVCSQAEK
jgi:hypothetical protein